MSIELTHLYGTLSAMGISLDATDTAFFSRELESVISRTFDVVYQPILGRTLLPVDRSIPLGTETIRADAWDMVGEASILANKAQDIPDVEVFRRSSITQARYIVDKYRYSIQDLNASRVNGVSLDAKRAVAARQAIEFKLDKVAAIGDTNFDLLGLLNQPSVPIVTLTTGTWATATDAQILEDLRMFVQSVVDNTSTTQPPDTLVLDPSRYGRLQRVVGADLSTTLLQVFLKNSPYIRRVEQWTQAALANAAGTGPRLVVYRNDPNVLNLYILAEFTTLAPQPREFNLIVPCYAATAGVVVHYPNAMAYADNS